MTLIQVLRIENFISTVHEIATKNGSPQKDLESSKNRFKGIGMRTSGDGGKMWDRSSTLAFSKTTCQWTHFHPRYAAKEALICTYFPVESDRYVSGTIVSQGRWSDCDILPELWNDEPKDSSSSSSIYIEIGANIGACVMEMLLSTNATIVAFEPDPRNLAQLTSTLMAMDTSYRNRIALFPIALGASQGNSTINQASDNRGNAVVGKLVKDVEGQQFLPPIPILVETLDSIFDFTNDWTVPLIKMDVQGYECYVVEGAKKVLEHTKTIKTELEFGKLRGHEGCSEIILIDKLQAAGFLVPTAENGDIIVKRMNTTIGASK